MAETLVKNPYCSKCGEEARAHAQFCFACGGSVIDPVGDDREEEPVSSEWFKGDIVEAGSEVAEEVESDITETLPADDSGSLRSIPKPTEVKSSPEEPDESSESAKAGEAEKHESSQVDEDEIKTKVRVKAKAVEEPVVDKTSVTVPESASKLKSAADLRKKPKPTRYKNVEVVWQEKKESPNVQFFLFSIVMSAIAVAIVFAAFYLK